MTDVKRPTIPAFVNNKEVDSRAPKRPRIDEDVAMKQQENVPAPSASSSSSSSSSVPAKATDIVPLTFDRMPWPGITSDNGGAFFVKEYNCMQIPLVHGTTREAAKIIIRTRLLFNPTQAFALSTAKPEVHFTAPRNSPQYDSSVEFNKRVPIIFKENHMKWGKDDSAIKGDLRMVDIPKPGGPKEKEAKAVAARARSLNEKFVAPPGTTFWEAKISAKWPWVFGTQERAINVNPKTGCVVLDESGNRVTDVLAFFKDPKTGAYQGKDWDVILVLKPYIWASNTQYKYGGSFKLEFMRVMGRVSANRTYDTSAVDGSSSSSSSLLSTSNFG